MNILTPTDMVVLKACTGILLLAVLWWVREWATRKEHIPEEFPLMQKSKASEKLVLTPTRSIRKRLEETGKDCIVFYGSQTGTAERFALQFSRAADVRFGVKCLVANPDDYDLADLKALPRTQMTIFILATYGEGEPTDNAIALDNWLTAQSDMASSEQKGLSNSTLR